MLLGINISMVSATSQKQMEMFSIHAKLWEIYRTKIHFLPLLLIFGFYNMNFVRQYECFVGKCVIREKYYLQ